MVVFFNSLCLDKIRLHKRITKGYCVKQLNDIIIIILTQVTHIPQEISTVLFINRFAN